MKYLKPIVLALFITLMSLLVAPLLMIPAMFLIKWDKEPSGGGDGAYVTTRGNLPWWLSWFETPDERLPGGLYEHAVQQWFEFGDRIHLGFGKYLASYHWLGLRNRAMGLAAWLGTETTDYFTEEPGMQHRGDLWKLLIPLGFGQIVLGYQVVRTLDKRFVAVPVISIKRN